MSSAIPQVALYVQRRPGSTETFMVGRLYADLAGYDWVLWHVHNRIEGGVQKFGDSHGGIDVAVVKFLQALPGKGLLAWRLHDDPRRNHDVIDFDAFLEMATYLTGGGRYRLIVPDALRRPAFFDVPKRHFPRYELPALAGDPRAVWRPIATAAPPVSEPAPDPLQPALF